MLAPDFTTPVGWCQCGCGCPTRLAPQTRREIGHVAGQPIRFILGHGRAARPVARFWAKVDRSGGQDACWPWTGGKLRRGYGEVRIAKTTLSAHRVAYELVYGP